MAESVTTRPVSRLSTRSLVTRKPKPVFAAPKTQYVLVMGFANRSGVKVTRVTIQANVPTMGGMLLQRALRFAIIIKQGQLNLKHLIDLKERILTCHPVLVCHIGRTPFCEHHELTMNRSIQRQWCSELYRWQLLLLRTR